MKKDKIAFQGELGAYSHIAVNELFKNADIKTCSTFEETFKILIPFGIILIPLFLSLFFSLTILIVGPFLNFNLSSLLLFSGSMAFADYLRAKILTGFPWNLWAYSFSWATEFLQILNISGFFVFNTIVITIFILPTILFFKTGSGKKILTLSFLVIIIFCFYIFGNHTLNQNEKSNLLIEEKFKIKVISPNFPLEYGLSKEKIKLRLEKLIKYSEPNKNSKTLFVWPEGVFSGYSYLEILDLQEIFLKNFNQNHLIIFGINKIDRNKKKFYNSLIVVNNKLEIIQEYKKQKLVPFGEFLPLEILLNKIGLKKITEGHGSFLEANNQQNIKIENLNILPMICYEIIFSYFVQQSKIDTNLIINISEDGWFGNSIGPYQHFAKGIFRAIEQNSYLIRSANKGISAIINNKGEVIKKLNPTEAGNIEFDFLLKKSKNKNKNDLIFFALLITYVLIFYFNKENNEKY